jgi:hypothetical protein
MITGRDALATIETAIGRARKNEGQLDATLRSAEEEAARLRADRTALFKELARIRLDAMLEDGITRDLDAAERRALQMVQGRSQQLKQQAGERQSLYKTVQQAEADRHQKAATLEQALAALETVKQSMLPKIRATSSWKAQQDRIADAEKVAAEADKKATLSEEDREQKRKPYEADSLFMYLWTEKFGEAEYDRGPFTRFFDRMVANKIGFLEARANYRMLNEIPRRLREHADRCRQAVSLERQNLAKAEADGMTELGAGELVGKVEKARHNLVEAEKALSSRKAELQDFEARTAAAAEDPAYMDAIEILAQADSREDIRVLYREAADTRTPADDKIIQRIEQLDGKLANRENEVEQTRHQARDMARRRADIERERDHFRQRGYDNPYGGFRDSLVLGQILGGILEGAVQGGILRDALRDHYRQRDNSWGGGVVLGPWTHPVPDNQPSSPSSGQWVPPWLDGGGSSGGSWGGDSGGWGGGDSGGGGDGFSTGGGV